MNWNPFKRIAELESEIDTLANRLNTLNDENALHVKRLNNLSIALAGQESRLQSLQNQFIARMDPTQSHAAVVISRADVEKEAKRRLKRAAYARKYAANKRAEKAAAAAAGDAK